MGQAFTLTVDGDIGRLVFNLPNEKVNKLSLPTLEELEKIVDQLGQSRPLKALIIESAKDDIFIAGADLHSFEKIFNDAPAAERVIKTGHRVFNKLAALPFPTIAYIHGACLGGGMELALACTYRIATDSPKTVLGLPEVSLGIIPGWGGTQRMPRLVGLMEGMNLILTAKPVKAQKAFYLHLADALVANEFKEEKINEFLKLCLSSDGKKRILDKRKSHGLKHVLLEGNPLGRALIFKKAENDIIHKTKGHYPAPLLALKVIKETYTMPLQDGLEVEAKTILDNLPKASRISKNLIDLFFIQESLKKDTGVKEDIKPNKISATGVLGAGVMGSGIAWLLTNNDFSVRLKDVDYNALGKGFGNIKGLYNKYVKDKRLKKNAAELKFSHLSGTTGLTGFQHVDLVIEAAIENLELKSKLFQELEAVIPAHAIVGSNTSSLSIAEMAKAFKHPERFIGIHFFNPVNRMPLVEVVPGPQTSPQTIATTVEFCKKIGKTPIVVQDCRGFLVNRIFTVGANELMILLEEGVPHEQLDKMMLDFGYPMGPFTLADEVGNDVMYKVNKILRESYGPRMQTPKIVEKMYENKLFGKKSEKGFYLYKGKEKSFNPQVLEWVSKKPLSLSQKEIEDRVILSMINEASRCLEEKIIERPDYLDMALIMGTGFPPFRGGLLKYADAIGIDYVANQLKSLEQKLGNRFAPSNLLVEMQSKNSTFYPSSK